MDEIISIADCDTLKNISMDDIIDGNRYCKTFEICPLCDGKGVRLHGTPPVEQVCPICNGDKSFKIYVIRTK